jgi:hypothetical protein
MFVQAASESRTDLYEAAWTALGILLVVGFIGSALVGVWMSSGGFSKYFSLHTTQGQRALADWLQDP